MIRDWLGQPSMSMSRLIIKKIFCGDPFEFINIYIIFWIGGNNEVQWIHPPHHDQEGVGERSVSTRARRVKENRRKYCSLYCCFVSSKPDNNKYEEETKGISCFDDENINRLDQATKYAREQKTAACGAERSTVRGFHLKTVKLKV